MPKVILKLDTKEIEKIIGQMTAEEKINLLRKLEKETLALRWKGIIEDINKRLKKFPLSKKDITDEITAYRKEKYAKSRS